MLAQRQLAREAGVYLLVRNFQTINTVGAASMAATFNCDGFASAHSSTSHYDRSSFVGLAVIFARPVSRTFASKIVKFFLT